MSVCICVETWTSLQPPPKQFLKRADCIHQISSFTEPNTSWMQECEIYKTCRSLVELLLVKVCIVVRVLRWVMGKLNMLWMCVGLRNMWLLLYWIYAVLMVLGVEMKLWTSLQVRYLWRCTTAPSVIKLLCHGWTKHFNIITETWKWYSAPKFTRSVLVLSLEEFSCALFKMPT